MGLRRAVRCLLSLIVSRPTFISPCLLPGTVLRGADPVPPAGARLPGAASGRGRGGSELARTHARPEDVLQGAQQGPDAAFLPGCGRHEPKLGTCQEHQNGPLSRKELCSLPGREGNSGSVSIGVRTGRSVGKIYNTLLKPSLMPVLSTDVSPLLLPTG